MLIRVNGGIEGIADYLINGKKSGRTYTRDELDQRVILSGDLALTDSIIQSMNGEGERYKHITLSFYEDNMPPHQLKAIADEFREYSLAAFGVDEYNFYAEAHLPKIKSLVDQSTGAEYERYPHIHVVIPTINLLSGNKIDLFRPRTITLKNGATIVVEDKNRFIDAFQEYINDKYGLASPKDSPRPEFTGASTILSRYKADEFKGENKEVKKQILDDVMKRDVSTYEDFKAMLSEYGAVRVRNPGKPTEYLNVKLPGEDQGINLKHFVFKSAFFDLSQQDREKFLTSENERRYTSAAEPRKTSAENLALMKEWREFRSREEKHINSGYRSFYDKYRKMSQEEKLVAIAEREARFYIKHREISHDSENRKPNIAGIGREPPPAARGRMRNLSELGMVRLAGRSEMLLPGDVPRDVEHQGAERNNTVRRPVSGRTGRRSDSVTGQLGRDLVERTTQQRSAAGADVAEIKRNLDASRLLAYLSKSHGVIPEKYEVSKGKDGSDRIKCGNRNLNVSDFLTKEMNLPWQEAAPILREAYAAQREQVPAQVQQQPGRELWQRYQEWRKTEAPQRKAEAIQALREQRGAALAEARQQFNLARGRIEGERGLTKAEQRQQIDMAKAVREHAIKQARDAHKIAEKAEREKWSPKAERLYSLFLAETAQRPDALAEVALAELRKRQPDIADKESAGDFIRADRDQAAQDAEHIRRSTERPLSYRVDVRGHVTYQIAGRDALKDNGRRVEVLQQDSADVIEEGLMLAKAKFGKKLTLTGTEEFKRRTVQVAVEKGMQVEFTDPALQRLKHELEEAKANRRRLAALGKQAVELAKAEKEKAKADAAHKAREEAKRKEEQTKAKAEAKRQAEQPKPAAKPAQEVAPTVPGSQLAKASGTHKGEIVSHDDRFVYQQTKAGMVHHPREQFKELPQPGEEVAIKYSAGRVQGVKDMGRDYGR